MINICYAWHKGQRPKIVISEALISNVTSVVTVHGNNNNFFSEYKITYSILNAHNARTQSYQFVKVKGTIAETDLIKCDADFNVIGQDVVCLFESDVDIGHYKCLSLKTGGSDGLDLTKVFDT